MTPRIAWPLVLAAILFGLVLRVSGLNARGLWGDEIVSLAFATGHVWMPPQTKGIYRASHYRTSLSLAPNYFSQHLVEVLQTDTQAPLYYYLLNLWMHLFGTSEAALRSLSIVVSVGTIPVLFMLGRELASPYVGVVSALLFAVAPYQVAFGQYARPYALMVLLALLSTYAALRLARGRGSWGELLGYAGAAVLGIYTHYLFVWTLAFHWILVASSRYHDRRFLARWVVTQIGMGIAVLPWVPAFLAQVQWSREASVPTWFYWHSGHLSFPETIMLLGRNVVLLLSVGRVRGLCVASPLEKCLLDSIVTWSLYIVAAVAIAFAAAKVVGHFRLGLATTRRGPNVWTVAMMWGLCILLGPFVLDWLTNSRGVSVHRYYIATSGPLYLAVAAAFDDISDRRVRRLLVPAFLIVLLAGSGLYLRGFSNTLIPSQEVREVAEYLDRAGHDSDLIVVLNPLPHPMDFAYYFRSNPQFARIEIPSRAEPSSHIAAQLRDVTRGRRRLWFIDDHGPEVEARRAILEWLRANYGEKEATKYKGLDLFLFSR